MKKKSKLIIAFSALFIFTFIGTLIYRININKSINTPSDTVLESNLNTITVLELAKYNGTDPNLPIYIGMNGYVYDVTQGMEFYKKGSVYNYLTGKDSSTELNLIGGDIIARKYKIVAILGK